MSNDAMTMPEISIPVKELFFDEVEDFIVFDKFIEFLVIHLESKLNEVLMGTDMVHVIVIGLV